MAEDDPQTIRLWLDIGQLVLPVLSALFLGWFITRKNEKFKNDLAKNLTNYQTRLTHQHQARLDAINRMSPIIGRIRDLLMASEVRDMGMPHLPISKQNTADQLREQTTALREIMAETGVYFDDAVVKLAGAAYSHSLLLDDYRILPNISSEGDLESQALRNEIRGSVESAISSLAEEFRKIVSPDSN